MKSKIMDSTENDLLIRLQELETTFRQCAVDSLKKMCNSFKVDFFLILENIEGKRQVTGGGKLVELFWQEGLQPEEDDVNIWLNPDNNIDAAADAIESIPAPTVDNLDVKLFLKGDENDAGNVKEAMPEHFSSSTTNINEVRLSETDDVEDFNPIMEPIEEQTWSHEVEEVDDFSSKTDPKQHEQGTTHLQTSTNEVTAVIDTKHEGVLRITINGEMDIVDKESNSAKDSEVPVSSTDDIDMKFFSSRASMNGKSLNRKRKLTHEELEDDREDFKEDELKKSKVICSNSHEDGKSVIEQVLKVPTSRRTGRGKKRNVGKGHSLNIKVRKATKKKANLQIAKLAMKPIKKKPEIGGKKSIKFSSANVEMINLDEFIDLKQDNVDLVIEAKTKDYINRNQPSAGYVCPIKDCYMSFPITNKRRAHMQKHHDMTTELMNKIPLYKRPSVCFDCKVMFPNAFVLGVHLRRYHPVTETCKVCQKSVFRTNLHLHMRSCNQSKTELCQICGKYYKRLDSHHRYEHAMAEPESDSRPYICDELFCEEREGYKTQGALIAHRKRSHPETLKCKDCGRAFTMAKFKKHLCEDETKFKLRLKDSEEIKKLFLEGGQHDVVEKIQSKLSAEQKNILDNFEYKTYYIHNDKENYTKLFSVCSHIGKVMAEYQPLNLSKEEAKEYFQFNFRRWLRTVKNLKHIFNKRVENGRRKTDGKLMGVTLIGRLCTISDNSRITNFTRMHDNKRS